MVAAQRRAAGLRGYTPRELVATLVVLLILIAIAMIVIPRSRAKMRMERDAQQARELLQGLAVWAQSGQDDYPLPSRIDRSNWTVAEEGRAKDTTPNIFSILVFCGLVKPEMLVSPAEVNPHIKPYWGYELSQPAGAVDPSRALWDPKLSGVLDGSRPGHISYATSQVSGGRRQYWANTFVDTQMALSLRGPEISGVVQHPDGAITPTLANPSSNTLRIHGGGKSWSGPMAFNDYHVEFSRSILADGKPVRAGAFIPYRNHGGQEWPDLWCYDEPDDPEAANQYLGIFIKAGETPADFKAAWD